MTSRDVRDIMEVSTPIAGPSNSLLSGPPPLNGIISRKTKRPDGISRELYALIGDNSPSLALAHVVKPKFKERIKRTGPNVKWECTSFSIPARSVGKEVGKEKKAREKLLLKHWVRDLPASHVEGAPENKFLKFNTNSQPYSYTKEEYDLLLKDEDWSKEETDYLFELAEDYDMRFIIMADRWDFPGKPRSVDDLKARYYPACRTLVKHRPTTDEAQKQATISSLGFDKGRELDRKAYLRSLLTRTPAQIAEEDFLYIESRRLEQSYNKIAAERSELLKILGGRDGIGATGGVQIGVGGGVKGVANREVGPVGVVAGEIKKRKGQVGWDYEGLDGGGLPEGWAGEGSTRKATIAQDIANCIERHPAPSVSATKAMPYPSVSVRSSRITTPKQTVFTKVQAALVELNISTHLIMPTRTNVEKLDNLQLALTQLVEMKKGVDRIEGELRMYRARKEGLTVIGEEEAEESAVVEKMVTGSTDLEKKNEAAELASRNKRSASVTSSTGTVTKRARRD